MLPSLTHVIKKRHHNRRRMRMLALVLVLVGSILLTCGLAAVVLTDREWSTAMPWSVLAIGFFLPAIPLWLFDDRLGRMLVPLPRVECPACRYSLNGLQRPMCPECGLALPMALLGGGSPLIIEAIPHLPAPGPSAAA
jgi:hypothetical protein